MERQSSPSLEGIRADHRYRYEFAASLIERENTVLDAACGVGYGSKMLHDLGAIVTGIDIYQPAIDFAQAHYPGPYYLKRDIADVEGQYDVVVSFETLEHLYDPKLILKKFRDKCSLLIASVPNEEHYPFNPVTFVSDEYPHLRHYTPTEFNDLLTAAGFRVKGKYCQKSKQGKVESGTDGLFLVYVAV